MHEDEFIGGERVLFKDRGRRKIENTSLLAVKNT